MEINYVLKSLGRLTTSRVQTTLEGQGKCLYREPYKGELIICCLAWYFYAEVDPGEGPKRPTPHPISHPYLTHISPISHPCLTHISLHISPISHPYLTHISPISHPYLTHISPHISPMSHPYLTPYLTHISPISHPYLTHISPISHPYLTSYLTHISPHISPISYPYLTHISPISHPYLTQKCLSVSITVLPCSLSSLHSAPNPCPHYSGAWICPLWHCTSHYNLLDFKAVLLEESPRAPNLEIWATRH